MPHRNIFISVTIRVIYKAPKETLRHYFYKFLSQSNTCQFLVFTHVTFVLTTVAIRHVGAQTNSYKCAYSKVNVR